MHIDVPVAVSIHTLLSTYSSIAVPELLTDVVDDFSPLLMAANIQPALFIATDPQS